MLYVDGYMDMKDRSTGNLLRKLLLHTYTNKLAGTRDPMTEAIIMVMKLTELLSLNVHMSAAADRGRSLIMLNCVYLMPSL